MLMADTRWTCEWCGKPIAGEPTSWACDDGPRGYPVCGRRCRMGYERFVGFKKPRGRPAAGLFCTLTPEQRAKALAYDGPDV